MFYKAVLIITRTYIRPNQLQHALSVYCSTSENDCNSLTILSIGVLIDNVIVEIPESNVLEKKVKTKVQRRRRVKKHRSADKIDYSGD